VFHQYVASADEEARAPPLKVVGSSAPMDASTSAPLRRFGSFELDLEAGRLLKNGRVVRIQPQPFKLLSLMTNRPGALITREEIHAALWPGDTFVDFDQGVHFAIKQVRDALGDRADDSLYVQTVPKRGYRFIAPIDTGREGAAAVIPVANGDPELQKALWANIVELRFAETRARRVQLALAAAVVALAIAMLYLQLT
jgi:DNA-binding winged helix-turn-helix (wHTH) protein